LSLGQIQPLIGLSAIVWSEPSGSMVTVELMWRILNGFRWLIYLQRKVIEWEAFQKSFTCLLFWTSYTFGNRTCSNSLFGTAEIANTNDPNTSGKQSSLFVDGSQQFQQPGSSLSRHVDMLLRSWRRNVVRCVAPDRLAKENTTPWINHHEDKTCCS
jgi:hypothetical protein